MDCGESNKYFKNHFFNICKTCRLVNTVKKSELVCLPGGRRIDVVARVNRQQFSEEWESAFGNLTGM